MDFTLAYNNEHACCDVTVSGVVYLSDLQTVFLAAWESADYTGAQRGLWDFTGAKSRFSKSELKTLRAGVRSGESTSTAHLSAVAAQTLADFTRQHRPSRLPPHVAIVAANALDFGMMRIYTGYVGFDDVDTQVFNTVDSARTWLASD